MAIDWRNRMYFGVNINDKWDCSIYLRARIAVEALAGKRKTSGSVPIL